ncbi:hypothetical protein [Staphylococcus gallinarum]|uniref:hypothetical protein n=1 Tax=Staphylococcus gallinarum TaxID=1293 RepID=UPI0030BB9AB6
MSALDNISELATYKVPVTITVEYKAEVKVTGRDWDDINEKIDEYIDEYYDDIATEVVASTGESELKKWEERF